MKRPVFSSLLEQDFAQNYIASSHNVLPICHFLINKKHLLFTVMTKFLIGYVLVARCLCIMWLKVRPHKRKGTQRHDGHPGSPSNLGEQASTPPLPGNPRGMSAPWAGWDPLQWASRSSSSDHLTYWGGHCIGVWGLLSDTEKEHFGTVQDLLWDV